MPTAWIHHHKGRNIPDLLITTMISHNNATTKMKISSEIIAQHVGDRLCPLYEERMNRLNMLTIGKIRTMTRNAQQ